MPRTRFWTEANDEMLREYRSRGMSIRAIAMKFQRSANTVVNRLAVLDQRDRLAARVEPVVEEPRDILREQQEHMRRLRSQRRGVEIPADREGEYYALLKAGLPIAEALKRLGISQNSNQ